MHIETRHDPFVALDPTDGGAARDASTTPRHTPSPAMGLLTGGVATIGQLQGFDILDHPMVGGLPQCPGQLVVARSTVALRRHMIGSDVVVLFDGGEVDKPIIVGVMCEQRLDELVAAPQAQGVVVHADDERHVIQAEREIVLRCGDASITLTRAGKVIIKGNYILSRSTGYNKIKGAAIDIN
jgi:hypothetical protein